MKKLYEITFSDGYSVKREAANVLELVNNFSDKDYCVDEIVKIDIVNA